MGQAMRLAIATQLQNSLYSMEKIPGIEAMHSIKASFVAINQNPFRSTYICCTILYTPGIRSEFRLSWGFGLKPLSHLFSLLVNDVQDAAFDVDDFFEGAVAGVFFDGFVCEGGVQCFVLSGLRWDFDTTA